MNMHGRRYRHDAYVQPNLQANGCVTHIAVSLLLDAILHSLAPKCALFYCQAHSPMRPCGRVNPRRLCCVEVWCQCHSHQHENTGMCQVGVHVWLLSPVLDAQVWARCCRHTYRSLFGLDFGPSHVSGAQSLCGGVPYLPFFVEVAV